MRGGHVGPITLLNQKSSADHNVTPRWECNRCLAFSSKDKLFCESCSQVSPVVEEELLVAEEYIVLDGVRAMAKGTEEIARRCFVVATESNLKSAHAWFWRARVALTMEELVRYLDRCVEINPRYPRARAALDQAIIRRDAEMRTGRALGEALKASARLGLRRSFRWWSRETSIDLASLACICLAVLWLGPLVAPAFDLVGVRMPDGVIPSFAIAPPQLPTWVAASPFWAVIAALASTARLDLIPHPWRVVAAVAYILAGFYAVGSGLGGRALVVVAGLTAVALIPYAATTGPTYVAAAAAVVGFGVLSGGIWVPARLGVLWPAFPQWSSMSNLRIRFRRIPSTSTPKPSRRE